MTPLISEEESKKLLEKYQALKAFRTPWETLWKDIAKYVSPRRSPGLQGTVTSPTTDEESRLFDITAGQAAMTLANGCLAWMSPQETPWFSFTPEEAAKDDEAAKWLNRCTVTTREGLGRSNFYTAIHEFYLDRSTFGTGCLYLEPSAKRGKKINVQCWAIGSYVIDEDDEGEVDTVVREMILTPRTAAQKFGRDNLSAVMRKKLDDGGSGAMEQCKFLHFIHPRDEKDRTPGGIGPDSMPIACIYMEEATGHAVRVSGYEEMPVMVSRYLEWGSNMGTRYGWSPAFAALPEARQVNFLQKMMDALAEKMAFPPVLAPEELEGEIDVNASGVTYFDKQLAGSLPKEWMTAGRYDVGKDRIMERQNAIKAAFHTDLFQMFSQLQKQMTAREVAERSSEKLIQFSPTFARLTTELFNPLLERLFGIGLRAGWFGEVPEAMIVDLGDGNGFVAPPQVLYSSRIALALRSLPVLALHRMLELTAGIAQFAPEVIDNFNVDEAWQMAALNEALPDGIARTKAEVDEIRAARAEAAQAAAQQQQTMMMAEGAAKLGGVPGDSPVGKAIGKQLEAAA